MYSLYQSYGLSKEFDSQFNTIDLTNATVSYVFNNYTKVYLSLNYSYSSTQILVDFDQLRSYYNSNELLSVVLSNLSPGFFTPLDNFNYPNVKYTRYIDAELGGYTINNYDYSPASNVHQYDLILNNPNIYPQSVESTCLLSVDGFIMPFNVSNQSILIENGFLVSKVNNYTKVGIISFEDIGNIITQPIGTNDIYLSQTRSPSELLYIKSYSIENYVTFLVLNGYLIAPTSQGFYSIGNGNYVLNLKQLGYYFKLLDSRYKQYYTYDFILNFLPSSLVSQYEITENKISRDIVENPLFINAYLTLPNTFLVFIPANNVVIKNKNILNSNIVNNLVLDYQPTYLMYGSQGRLVDYTFIYRDGKYIISSPNMYINNYIDEKNLPNLPSYIRDNRVPDKALAKSQLAFKQYGLF